MIRRIVVTAVALVITVSTDLMADITREELRDHYVKLIQESATATFPSGCRSVETIIAHIEPEEYDYLSRYSNSVLAAFEDELKEKMDRWIWDEGLSDEERRIVCAYYAGRAIGGFRSMLELVDEESIEALNIPAIGEPLSEIERAMQR